MPKYISKSFQKDKRVQREYKYRSKHPLYIPKTTSLNQKVLLIQIFWNKMDIFDVKEMRGRKIRTLKTLYRKQLIDFKEDVNIIVTDLGLKDLKINPEKLDLFWKEKYEIGLKRMEDHPLTIDQIHSILDEIDFQIRCNKNTLREKIDVEEREKLKKSIESLKEREKHFKKELSKKDTDYIFSKIKKLISD